jgi:serpin B
MTEQNHPNYKVGGVLVHYGILKEGRACDRCGGGIEHEGYSDGDGYDVCMNCVEKNGKESQETEQLIDFHWLKVKQVQLVLALIRYFNGKGTGNVVFSPHSLFTLLFMLSCGANNCADLRQYCNPPILTGEDPSDEKKNSMVEDIKDLLTDIPEACLSEKIIMCDSLQTVFEENMKKLNANFFSLEDMGVVNEIVQNLTSIPDLIRQKPDATVLIDAIYFKDEWSCKFDGKSTTQDFQNTTTTLKCQMMENKWQKGKGLMLCVLTANYEAVWVEYKTENLGAWFVMGKNATMANNALEKFLEDFGSGNMDAQGVKVNLQVPKFELTSNIDLLKVFKGADPQITSVFEEGHLLPMTGERNERITNFTQQCFIKVDENGTEAAAATKAETYRSIEIPKDIKFDHTFYMVISDSNGRIFFVAKVEDPSPAPAGPPASAGGDKEQKINPFIVNVQGHEYSHKTVAEHPQSAEDDVQHTKVPNSKREHEQSAASIKDDEDIIAERLAILKRFRKSEYIIAERLAMLKRFRGLDLITEEQYQKRIGEILQDT